MKINRQIGTSFQIPARGGSEVHGDSEGQVNQHILCHAIEINIETLNIGRSGQLRLNFFKVKA